MYTLPAIRALELLFALGMAGAMGGWLGYSNAAEKRFIPAAVNDFVSWHYNADKKVIAENLAKARLDQEAAINTFIQGKIKGVGLQPGAVDSPSVNIIDSEGFIDVGGVKLSVKQ